MASSSADIIERPVDVFELRDSIPNLAVVPRAAINAGAQGVTSTRTHIRTQVNTGELSIQLGMSTSTSLSGSAERTNDDTSMIRRPAANVFNEWDSEAEYDFCSLDRLDSGRRRGTNSRRTDHPAVNISIVVNNPEVNPASLQLQDAPQANIDVPANFGIVSRVLDYILRVVHESFTGTVTELLKEWVLKKV